MDSNNECDKKITKEDNKYDQKPFHTSEIYTGALECDDIVISQKSREITFSEKKVTCLIW